MSDTYTVSGVTYDVDTGRPVSYADTYTGPRTTSGASSSKTPAEPQVTQTQTQTRTRRTGRLPGTEKKLYRYPYAHQADNQDYIRIRCFRYKSANLAGRSSQPGRTYSGMFSGRNEDVLFTTILPIPMGLADTNAVTWGEDTLGPFGELVAGAAASGMNSQNRNIGEVAQSMMNSIASGTANFGENTSNESKTRIQNYLAGMAANIAGANVDPSSLMTRSSGSIMHSNLELLFKGVNLRQFGYSWEFSPRNEDEAMEVKHIIRLFKQAMSPSDGSSPGVGGGGGGTSWFIESPAIFQLQFMQGGRAHPFLHSFKPCAMTDISMNYAASAMHSTYDDGTPVHMQMRCSFKEINPIYNEDYDHPSAGEGVGF